jgi:hypothetical protein
MKKVGIIDNARRRLYTIVLNIIKIYPKMGVCVLST